MMRGTHSECELKFGARGRILGQVNLKIEHSSVHHISVQDVNNNLLCLAKCTGKAKGPWNGFTADYKRFHKSGQHTRMMNRRFVARSIANTKHTFQRGVELHFTVCVHSRHRIGCSWLDFCHGELQQRMQYVLHNNSGAFFCMAFYLMVDTLAVKGQFVPNGQNGMTSTQDMLQCRLFTTHNLKSIKRSANISALWGLAGEKTQRNEVEASPSSPAP
jgi:hypothetical protein